MLVSLIDGEMTLIEMANLKSKSSQEKQLESERCTLMHWILVDLVEVYNFDTNRKDKDGKTLLEYA